MKYATRIWFSIGLLALLLGPASAAFAQGTPDGVTPAVEETCAKVRGGAGFGICVAYCEANDCDLEPGSKECARLRANYEKTTGSSTLPCDGEMELE